MQRKVAVLFAGSLVVIFGTAACGGALTTDQADALEEQGKTQEQLLKVQQEQQNDIDQLKQEVTQLKQQPKAGETTQPGANQKGGTTEKAK
jgi:peptidoglycan hydrolase CwlO-like protein